MGPNDKFDLVIKGGTVFDPSQRLNAKRDVGMRFGVIEALEADIPAARAQRVLDASGRTVLPGLIDLHSHVFPYGSPIGIPADELIPYQGTATAVSAGDAGANNFTIFRRHIVAQTRTRLYAFVHIANIGLGSFPVAELLNIDFAQPEMAARAVAENADIVIGIKVRMSENVIARHGLEPLRRAIRACELSGHRRQGDVPYRRRRKRRSLMSQILDALRRGDVLTHCYSGARTFPGNSRTSCRRENYCRLH
jgi:dihydroorotase